jgi:hypothetical protein
MWRSKHSTMTIRPEFTVTPYRATSCHRSASAVGRGGLFLPPRGAWGLGIGLGLLKQDWCLLGVSTSSLQGIFHLVGTTLWELNFHTCTPTALLLAIADARSTAPPASEVGSGSAPG